MTNIPLLPSILLVGCGKMGGAMLEGWLARGLAPSVIIDRHLTELPAPHSVVRSLDAIPANFKPDIILVAVKPQKANGVLAELAQRFPNGTLLSVMAGRTIASLLAAYREGNATASPIIIRSMPNTPSALGAGMSGLYAPPEASEEQKKQCDQLLSAVGETVWVEQEGLIDSVAAISGSGPAYVFLLAELLEQAGVEQGLDASTARALARAPFMVRGRCCISFPPMPQNYARTLQAPVAPQKLR